MIRRSYIIRTEKGQTPRRNRRDLLHTCERYSEEYPDLEHPQGVNDVPNTQEEITSRGGNDANDEHAAPGSYTTRYVRIVKPQSYFY